MTASSDTPGAEIAVDLESKLSADDRGGIRELIPLYYAELRRVAHNERSRVSPFCTLDTTSVVHEAYLRLLDERSCQSHAHFLRLSAKAMRYVLIDYLRGRMADKRGSGQAPISLHATDAPQIADVAGSPDAVELVVHEALEKLAEFAPRTAAVVECRYFAGYTDAETARALEISERTVRYEWTSGRAWLARELGEAD